MTEKRDYRPSMVERSIGRTLRRWRNDRSLSLSEAGELFGCSGAKLSMIENALQPAEQAEVIALGLAYKVAGAVWKPLAKQAELETQRRHHERSPTDRTALLNVTEDLEEIYPELSVVRGYGINTVPRLPSGWMRRMDSGDAPQVELLVTEDAVRQEEDGRVLLNVVHLAERRLMDVRVLTTQNDRRQSTQQHFILLSFLHRKHDDVMVTSRVGTTAYVEDPIVCELALQGFDMLQRTALEPRESIDFIADVVDGRL